MIDLDLLGVIEERIEKVKESKLESGVWYELFEGIVEYLREEGGEEG